MRLCAQRQQYETQRILFDSAPIKYFKSSSATTEIENHKNRQSNENFQNDARWHCIPFDFILRVLRLLFFRRCIFTTNRCRSRRISMRRKCWKKCARVQFKEIEKDTKATTRAQNEEDREEEQRKSRKRMRTKAQKKRCDMKRDENRI